MLGKGSLTEEEFRSGREWGYKMDFTAAAALAREPLQLRGPGVDPSPRYRSPFSRRGHGIEPSRGILLRPLLGEFEYLSTN